MNTVGDVIRQNRVLDLGPLPAPRLPPGATVHQSLQFLVRGRRGAIVVVEDATPVGIFTERDVLYRFPGAPFRTPEERKRTPLRQVMSHPPVTVRRQATLREATDTMVRRQLRHLIVVDRNGELKGLLTSNDMVQFLTDQFPEDTVNLPPRLRQQFKNAGGA